MATTATRGAAYTRITLFHHRPQLPALRSSVCPRRVGTSRARGLPIFARYSRAQEFSTRFQDGIGDLPKLVEEIVQTSINTGPRGALRLAQGIQAVIGVGGEWLADVSKTINSSNALPNQMQLGLLSPLYLRRLFERMGATYIKLGQFIASAPTLFPAEYVQEFQNCFDKAPEVPFNVIEAVLRDDLGRSLDSVYEYIDPVPIASASIAQVHGARLKGSKEEVVIKVLKPGIEDVLIADLNFVYIVARLLEFINPELRRTALVGIVQDIKESMLEEVDFRKEAANIESFRGYLENMGLTRQATAPKVYQHCSTRRILTMERLYGVPLTDLDSIKSLSSDPEMTLVTALNVWFGSLLACETFHADVHAGNLWLLRDGRIGFLDFGIVGRISPKTWAAMEMFLASFASEEYEVMASALIDMGATEKNVDVKAFARDLEKIFSSIQVKVGTKGAEECGDFEEWFNYRVSRAAPETSAEFLGSFVADKTLSEFTKGGKWLVWKFEGDRTLADYMRDRGFPLNLESVMFGRVIQGLDTLQRSALIIKQIMRQIITSLRRIHDTGIVHRDIKPAHFVVTRKGQIKLIDFGAATDLRIGKNYVPNRGLLDPDYCPPELYVLPEETPKPPPEPIAAILSPILWQFNSPDLFDMYSAGIILMQMAVPTLRSSSGLRNFNSELKMVGYDLSKWREFTRSKPDLQLLDLDSGRGWDLATKLISERGYLGRGRLSAAAALRHPYFLLGGDQAASVLSKLTLFT